eukprot:jgi/Undpi1/5124/HiC_scaffold_19.g08476.m1
MVGGASLLGLIGLTTYLAAFALDATFPLDVYKVFYSFYFFIFCFSVSFWLRILRLGLAYCPKYKRKLPWLMSERLLVCFSILAGLASISIPFHEKRTAGDDPFAWVYFTANQEDQLFICQVVLVVAAILLFPVVWYVDDLFRISTELLVATILQIIQTGGNFLADKYGDEKTKYWINKENIPFTAGIVLFSIGGSKRGLNSEITEPDSQLERQNSQCEFTGELGTPHRRHWSYENLAAVPGMAAAFRAFAFRALCEESVVFLEEVSRYQNGDYSVCSPATRNQKSAFSAIVARFIADGSADEVNISWGDKKQILELSRSDAELFDTLDPEEKRTVFGDAYNEIRHVLETNLLLRFTTTQEFKDEELKGESASRSFDAYAGPQIVAASYGDFVEQA